jgi:hypothetical protein
MAVDEQDSRGRRCPRLGGPVTFGYCRSCEPDRLPCRKLLDCWWETFDILSYVREYFPEGIRTELLDPVPKPKMNHLLELIEAAQKRMEES